MREEILQFIWRFLYFDRSHLFTETGEEIQILSPGELNNGQGPDFRNARLRIGGRLLEGPVELHIKASDWERHGHTADANYQNVILHVVWDNDRPPNTIPVLVLQHRVPKLLLGQYGAWMKSRLFVPCASQLPQVDAAIWAGWKEQLLLRRLYQRVRVIRDGLEASHQHWEEVTWWLMARCMGSPVNSDVFEAIARSIPIRLLIRHRNEPARMNNLLLGQAGLLEGEIPQREYRFLRTKYELSTIPGPLLFGRMRPAHHPARRLEQLTKLFGKETGWFARIKEAESPTALEPILQVEGLGADMKRGLLINAFVPLLFAYGWLRGEPVYREKALRWLREEPAEKNSILLQWQRLGVSAITAADSQSLLELKKQYCGARRCLECAIGRTLLGREAKPEALPPSS